MYNNRKIRQKLNSLHQQFGHLPFSLILLQILNLCHEGSQVVNLYLKTFFINSISEMEKERYKTCLNLTNLVDSQIVESKCCSA